MMQMLLFMFCHSFMSLLMVFADGGYAGKLEELAQYMGKFFGHGIIQKGLFVLLRHRVGLLVKQHRPRGDHGLQLIQPFAGYTLGNRGEGG